MVDKVVIVTGASSGIGLAIAREFANNGSKVVLAARNYDKLQEIEKDIISKGKIAFAVKTDVSIEEDAKNLIEKTIEKFGDIHILINNAGVSMRAMFNDLNLDVIKKVMNINFWGTVYCTKYALPYILKNKGSVVGISSVSGFSPLPARTGYCASKYAIHGFLETLRIENLKTGLHVLIVTPGFTSSNIRNTALSADGSPQKETPRNESKMMSAEEVARRVYRAVKKRKRFQVYTVIGKAVRIFNYFLPRFTDNMVYKQMAKEPNSPLKK